MFYTIPPRTQTPKRIGPLNLKFKIFGNAIAEYYQMTASKLKGFNRFTHIEVVVGGYEKLLLQFKYLVNSILNEN